MTTTTPTPSAFPRSSRRAWAARIAAWSLLAGAAAYISCPLWFPATWLAERLTEQLSADLGRPVSIRAARVGWIEGVIFEELRVADLPGGAPQGLARIGRLQAAFTPFRTLFSGKVSRLQVDNPEVWLALDEAGHTNVDDLADRRPGNMPTFDYAITGLVCHVATPRVSQTFHIDQFNLRLEPGTGRLGLTGLTLVQRPTIEGRPPGPARLSVDSNVRVPRLKRGEQLTGEVQVEWSNLSLTDLPVPLISRLPVEQVAGVSTGRLALTIHPDLEIDYAFDVDLNGVRMDPAGRAEPVEMPNAALHCAGRWNPNNDLLRITEVTWATSGLQMRGDPPPGAAALRLEQNGESPLEAYLSGTVRDWAELRREVPEVAAILADLQLRAEGQASFTAYVNRTGERERMILAVDGRSSSWQLGPAAALLFDGPMHLAKSMRLDLSRDHATSQLTCPEFRVTVGGLELSGAGQMALPPTHDTAGDPEPEATPVPLATASAKLDLQCTDVAEALAHFPTLARTLQALRWSGPIALQATLEPHPEESACRFSLRLPAEAEVTVGPFHKPHGEPLTIVAEGNLPHRPRPARGLALYAAYRSGIVRLDPTTALLDAGWDSADLSDESEQDVSAELSGAWSIERLEDLLELFPAWQTEQRRSQTELSGDMGLTGRVRLGLLEGQPSVSMNLSTKGDALALRIGRWLDKPAGMPMTAQLVASSRRFDGRGDHRLSGHVAVPGMAVQGQFALGEGGTPEEAFEQATLTFESPSLESLRTISPALGEAAVEAGLTGQVLLNVAHLRSGDSRTGQLSFDGHWRAAGHGQAAATPVGTTLGWSSTPAPDDAARQILRLTECRVRLPGVQIEEAHATIPLPIEPGPVRLAADRGGFALIADQLLSNLQVSARGNVHFTPELAAMHPQVAELLRTHHLQGSGDFTVQAIAEQGDLRMNGQLDAGSAGMAFDTGQAAAPVFDKPAGFTARADFDVQFADWLGSHPTVRIHECRLRLGRSDIELFAEYPRQPGDGPTDWQAFVDCPEIAELARLLPGLRLEVARGRALAEMSLQQTDGGLNVREGRAVLEKATLGTSGCPVSLDGEVTFSPRGLNLRQLSWGLGQSAGSLSGVLRSQGPNSPILGGEGFDVTVGLALDRVSRPEFDACLTTLISNLAGASPTAGAPEGESSNDVLATLSQSDLRADFHIGTLETPLPLSMTATAEALSGQALIHDGHLEVTFGCLADGGIVAGKLESELRAATPFYRLTYTAERLEPGTLVQGYLRRTFPGLTASGPLTLIDESIQQFTPPPDGSNYEVGKGELIIEGGVVTGRAAPMWVTRIFPGLNLASFEFSRMHSWFDKSRTGQVSHQMIFQGSYYNVYMIGSSQPDGRFSYEVGIDFMAGLESQYWANTGQGRIPLFNKTGQVLGDGTLVDERVQFVSLPRTLETLFVRNNPVWTGYHAVRKRVLAQ